MAIRYKNRQTKEIAEYDSTMGLFYIEGKYFKDTGDPIPESPVRIQNDPNWEYFDDTTDTKLKKEKLY